MTNNDNNNNKETQVLSDVYESLQVRITKLEKTKGLLCQEASSRGAEFYEGGQAELLVNVESRLAMYKKEAEQVLEAIRQRKELEA